MQQQSVAFPSFPPSVVFPDVDQSVLDDEARADTRPLPPAAWTGPMERRRAPQPAFAIPAARRLILANRRA